MVSREIEITLDRCMPSGHAMHIFLCGRVHHLARGLMGATPPPGQGSAPVTILRSLTLVWVCPMVDPNVCDALSFWG